MVGGVVSAAFNVIDREFHFVVFSDSFQDSFPTIARSDLQFSFQWWARVSATL